MLWCLVINVFFEKNLAHCMGLGGLTTYGIEEGRC